VEYPAANPETPVFSFITTCKGRLQHLQQTLPLMVRQENSEVVVVDYGCPQNTDDWVEQNFPQVKVVRVTDDEGFCASRARNMGAQAAQSEWLIFIDADILLVGDLLTWLRPQLAPGIFFRAGNDDFDMYGTFLCRRDDFEKTGGYDELLRGWGREDKDIYYRLGRTGCEQKFFPEHFLDVIKHGDEERTRFSPYKNRFVSQIISSLYLQMKYDLESLPAGQSGTEMHQRLYAHARDTILTGLNQAPNANMTARMELGRLTGASSSNPLCDIERKLVYVVKKRTHGPTP